MTEHTVDTHGFPEDFRRYCTQSVMALPLQVLHASFGMDDQIAIAECSPKSMMRINVTRSRIDVHKRMRIFHTHDAIDLPVDIHIVADDDAYVSIRFDFGARLMRANEY